MLGILADVVIAEQPAAATLPRRRWTRDEYYRMAEAGIYKPGERVRPLRRPDAEIAFDALLPRVG